MFQSTAGSAGFNAGDRCQPSVLPGVQRYPAITIGPDSSMNQRTLGVVVTEGKGSC
ncbi:MAG: hypothetical protein KF908_00145 [Nitrosomonas sp.]|nr:hypothetical protein [Nitrosomonas sp.]